MINLALIGSGKWGSNYIQAINLLPNTRLKYICGKNDYKDLLQKDDIDGVIIATPSSTHFSIVKQFLEKNFNVLLEKPAAITYSDTKVLNTIYNKKKSILMIGHIYLYNPAYRVFKDKIKEVGKIQHAEFEGTNWGPFRVDASALWDWGPHDISMCLDLLGMPDAVRGLGINILNPQKKKMNDMVYCNLEFKNPLKAFVKFGSLSLTKTRKVTIIGSESILEFDDKADKKITLINNKTGKIFHPVYGRKSPLEEEVAAFVECIIKKEEPFTSIDKAVGVAHVLDCIEKSILKNGKKIFV